MRSRCGKQKDNKDKLNTYLPEPSITKTTSALETDMQVDSPGVVSVMRSDVISFGNAES